MILDRDLFDALGLDLKIHYRVIVGGNGPYEQFLAPMVDVSNYDYAPQTDKNVKLDESFPNLYAADCFESKI